MGFTIIHYYGKSKSKCGYCKGLKCNESHGMHAVTMTPQDYEDLIDRGWRRSGHYCYKPDNKVTCCPCYTIKCNALEFNLSKSHKKILKRMSRFLRDGIKDKCEENEAMRTANADSESAGISEEPAAPNVPIRDVNLEAVMAANPPPQKQSLAHVTPPVGVGEQVTGDCIAASTSSIGGGGDATRKSLDTSKPPCKKAKQMRLERKKAKLATKLGITAEESLAALATVKSKANQQKTLSDYLTETSFKDKHKLRLDLVLVRSKEFKNTLSTTYALYEKYQTCIHNDRPDSVNDYLDFLQRSPLQHTKTQDGPAMGYGSFHQQYWLDDKLIAVGVIDILPHCVSSVYFFYDPDYSFLSLGTYGSLREIDFVCQLASQVPAIKSYYMGYYIHSCPKMRYKGKLVPSYLLCPETYTWNLLTDAVRMKLDAHKYQRLDADTNAIDPNRFLENHLDAVLLLLDTNTYVTYRQYIQITGEDDDRDEILEYGRLVGKACAHRMLFLKE